MSKRDRAWRRAQRARMIARAINSERIRWWYGAHVAYKSDEYYQEIKRQAIRLHDIMQPCSCYACGNQRHSGWLSNREKLTIAERKAEDSFNDQVDEIDSSA